MQKENQRVTLTKKLLKEALVHLLHKKPLAQINVSELCKEAGINRATFYRHYGCPGDVLVEFEMDMLYEIREIAGKPQSMKEAKNYLDKTCQYLYDRSDIIKHMIRGITYEDFLGFLNELYGVVLKEQLETAQWKELTNYDADSTKLITTYFGGGGYLLLRQWLMEDIKKTPEEISNLIWSLFHIQMRQEEMCELIN